MRALLSILLALVVAGCLGGDAPEAPVDAAAVNASASATGDAEVMAANETLEPAGPVVTPFSFSGSTPEGACSIAGCHWLSPGSEDFHPLAHEGHATAVTVEVDYRDVPPGMEFYVGICTGEGDSESAENVTCGEYTTGPSPLSVTFDLSASHVPGQMVALSFGALNGMSTMSGAMVFGASNFDATGTLTAMPTM